MKTKHHLPLLLAALVGCEQADQPLPFDATDVVTREVAAGVASTISTPAGASILFPAESLPGTTTVTLGQVAAPAAAQRGGTAVSAGYRLEPAGLELRGPARAELKFGTAGGSDSWLASVVSVVDGRVRELGGTRVDLSAGLVQTDIRQLGTLAVVIPEPAAVFRLGGRGMRAQRSVAASELLATGTDSVTVDCGDPDNRCSGIDLDASQNLRDMVEDAAAVYPQLTGALRIGSGTATGALSLRTTIRVLLSSGSTAENLEFSGDLRPTASSVVAEDASRITISNVHFTISGTNGSESRERDTLGTLTITKGASAGSISISRSFQIRNSSGQLEDADVTLVFPVQIHQ